MAHLFLTRFRSLPFYLVAVLLHLLFLLIFGTYEMSSGGAAVITQFVAPGSKTEVDNRPPPPPPPSTDRKEQDLVKKDAKQTSTPRPTMITTPLPNATVVIATVPTPTPQLKMGDLNKLSNVKVSAIYNNRLSNSARSSAIGKYGGAGTGMVDKVEGGVQRALLWLKEHQNSDGSWGGTYRPSMTGLALLTFLAHGDTQASQQFGETVQKGVQYLMDLGRKNNGRLGSQHVEYQHPIATYALAEDYALTQISDLLTVLEGAVTHIVKSQCENGSWNYGYNTKPGPDPAKRPFGDLSISGWNIQALKAAHNAGVKVQGLDASMQKALGFTRAVYDEKSHKFGYASKGGGSPALVGVGVLCMQFLGAGDAKEARGGQSSARDFKCNWEKGSEASSYMWYYVTQAMFQAGGSYWIGWNREFRDEIIKRQKPDGHWPVPGGDTDAPRGDGWKQVTDPKDCPVYHTSLLCMMLEVYYRFLPTFK